MIDTIDSLNIKNWLALGPKVPLADKPLFQLVWSDDAREKRKGVFSKWENGIQISTYEAIEEVLKYNWLKERWILEQWFSPEVTMLGELVESNQGSYEPVYVFEDSKGLALPLNLKVVQFIVQQSLKPATSAQLKQSVSKELIANREQQARNKDCEILNDEGPLVSQFHDGTAILRP